MDKPGTIQRWHGDDGARLRAVERRRQHAQLGSPGDYWFADTNAGSVDAEAAACANPPSSDPPHYSSSGASWMLFGYDQTFYNHVIGPNSTSADCSPVSVNYGYQGGMDGGIVTARSHHGPGVNLLTADGSVHFITSGIACPCGGRLGTRAGGEIISSGF